MFPKQIFLNSFHKTLNFESFLVARIIIIIFFTNWYVYAWLSNIYLSYKHVSFMYYIWVRRFFSDFASVSFEQSPLIPNTFFVSSTKVMNWKYSSWQPTPFCLVQNGFPIIIFSVQWSFQFQDCFFVTELLCYLINICYILGDPWIVDDILVPGTLLFH